MITFYGNERKEMRGCFFAIFGLAFPRLTLLILWLIGWAGKAFDGWIFPIIGFIFLPYTTLAYLFATIFHFGPFLWIVVLLPLVSWDVYNLYDMKENL